MILKIGTYSLEVLRDGYSWNENCGENGKHATSSVSLSVRPVDGLVTYLMSAESNLNATLMTDGGKVLFTGVVRPYTSHYYEGSFQGNISLEIMDYTETLHKYVWPESEDGRKEGQIYTDVWTGKTLPEVVVALFALAGRTCATFSSSESLAYFKLKGSAYLDDIIEELLYEYGLDYRWTASGTAEVFSTFVDGQSVGKISDVRGQLRVQRSDDTTEGIKISWKEYEYQDNVPLLKFNSGNMSHGQWGGSVTNGAGKFYSGAMHDSYFNPGKTMPDGNLWSWNFPTLARGGNDALLDGEGWLEKKIFVDGLGCNYSARNTNSVLTVETSLDKFYIFHSDKTISDIKKWETVLESYDVNGCRMWLDYDATFASGLGYSGWEIDVYAYGNIATAVDSTSTYNVVGANPESVSLEYRMGQKGSTVISEAFVKQLYLRTKYSKVTYSFSSLTSYTLGGFYTLEGNTVRIISKTQNEEGIYSYKCEGCKPYSEVDIPVIDEARSVTKVDYTGQSAYDAARENGYTGTKEEWLNSLKGTSSAGLYLYKRADSLPESFDGGAITYTFATGVMTGSFGTWSTSIPSGDSTLYFVYCRVTSKDETYTVTTGEWSVPAIMSETGAKGADGKTVSIITIYQRAASKPAVPSETVTYNFGSFTATGLGAWSLSMVEGTDPLWATSATAISSDGASDSIEPSEWITPVVIVENGKGGLTISTSADSWVFPADEDGIVKSSEYEKFSVEVLAVRGGKSVEFTMSAETTGISFITVSGNTVKASSSTAMTGDSASVKLNITAEGETYVKTISLAKAKQSKPTELWFAWSKSESIFTPKDSNFWIVGTSFIYFSNSLIGNIPFTNSWVNNWAEIEAAKTEEYCYLWCKTSEDGTPFLFTGATGKTGACTMYQYALGDAEGNTPADSDFSDTMPTIQGTGKMLWTRYKVIPAGGLAGDVEWSEAKLVGTDNSEVYARITDAETNIAEITKSGGLIEQAITKYDSETGETMRTSISQNSESIKLKVGLSEDGTQLAIGEDTILLDAPKVLVPKSLTANEVDGENFFGKEFIVKEGGSIESTNGKFSLGDDGILHAEGAVLKKAQISEEATFEGTIISEALETVNTEGSGTITLEAFPTGEEYQYWWSPWDMYYNVLQNYESFYGITVYSGTLIINGVTYTGGFAVYSKPKTKVCIVGVDTSGNRTDFDYRTATSFKDDIQITYNGSVILQIGASYSSWIGNVPKLATFPTPQKDGSALTENVTGIISGGTYNGYVLYATSDRIYIKNETLTVADWNVGQKGKEWPSSITYSTKEKGSYITSLFPKTAKTGKIGSQTAPFYEVNSEILRGKLIGTVTGNVTGDITGNVYGDLRGNVRGNVNVLGTSYAVYGCKFGAVILCNFIATGATTKTLEHSMTDYEFITIYAFNQYSCGVYTFPTFLWSAWSTYNSRLVLSTDARYVGIYFPSTSSISVADLSPQHQIVMYGIK